MIILDSNKYYNLGSVSMISDLNGTASQYIEYIPFGEEMYSAHRNTYNSPYHYTAKELDEETGLYYYGARYYNSKLSIWLSVDPMVEKYISLSPYNYVMNNPIKYIDPDGREVINGHKKAKDNAERNKINAEVRLNEAKKKLTELNKDDVGYKTARKDMKKARKELKTAKTYFNNINEKYQRVERKLQDIKEKDPELFESADNLKDPGGTEIDIYVHDISHNKMQELYKTSYEFEVCGLTIAEVNSIVVKYPNNTPEYYSVKTETHGKNTIMIIISDNATTLIVAHEFGHAIYLGGNMKQYFEWLEANPNEKGKGGHGKGDPNGKAAEKAEKNFR